MGEGVDPDLGIAGGAEPGAAGGEARPLGAMIEQLAIGDGGEASARIGDRLTAVGRIDQRQPPRPEGDAGLEVDVGVVGAAVGDRGAHRREPLGREPAAAVEVHRADDAAHRTMVTRMLVGARLSVHNARVHRVVASLLALTLGGCAYLGVVGDGSTVAWGPANEGALIDGRAMPPDGEGFVVPSRWRQRGNQWGTDELIGVITHAGHRVAAQLPGSRIGVADLSIGGGGRSPHHRSHQNGRDADLLFFVTDGSGASVELDVMRHFGDDGGTVDAGPRLVFDAPRTWVLVRGLLEAPGPGVKHLFIYAPLRDQLLDHARAIGEPDAVIAWAGEVLSQPGDSAPHDDHLHLRIHCPDGDDTCVDYGARTARKKPALRPEHAVARGVASRPIVGTPWFRMIRW